MSRFGACWLELPGGIFTTAILTGWTRIGAYAAGAWLLGVAVNLAAAGYLDVAVRDVVMAIAAFTLAKLTEVREESASHALDAVAVRPSRRVTA